MSRMLAGLHPILGRLSARRRCRQLATSGNEPYICGASSVTVTAARWTRGKSRDVVLRYRRYLHPYGWGAA